ncbi:glutathione-disulfide reductase [Pyruvatibacter mobilis]|uniref:Glutathione reductase n=1 Tax=Pyruvatibacter mobilis TaxID=1712261 RepID=A0A845QAF2_9HYPH|nr:glutathione-disulfide reductase [Pyruvatibacter mobilis]NBG95454.1 glutathione-disulfide reductase [Pyruvatibacter mobilis]QJD75459.1 glutathione-disulfide reductase [Pyruvatibacter mobilis]GGD15807.1 glutathione-disulfide reductase [Pyruvatibacter mobilis]
MSEYDYDLFTIGAGSGGVRASRMAASYGARVAVAEEYRVGGTCVIRGCVPKKLFVYASHVHEEIEDATGFGWTVEGAKFDWKTLIANKDKEIDRLNGIYIGNLEGSAVEIVEDRAVIKDKHTIHLVNQNRDVTAKTILIATGATPNIHEVPGHELAITSNEAFHLDELPKRVVVAGGGYIAVEFAGIFNGLGSETTLVYRGEEILRGFDNDLRRHLHMEMEKKGVTIRTQVVFEKIEKTDDGLAVTLNDGTVIETDAVMFAIGRVPNTKGLGLENAGVKMSANGTIEVDAYSRTNVDNIYAVGDVTNRANLTPVAIREGAAFAETVFANNPVAVDHSCIPTAVFSTPEIGTVGISEEVARERFDRVDVYKSTFRPMKHTLSGRDERTMMKLVVDPASDRVLGVHMIGPASGEIVQAVGIAVQMGATKAQFDATIAVHPTAAEELVTMKTPEPQPTAAAAE